MGEADKQTMGMVCRTQILKTETEDRRQRTEGNEGTLGKVGQKERQAA